MRKKVGFRKNILSMPIIWLPLPFLLLVDITVELYHRLIFPWYQIPLVERTTYIQVWDRWQLPYIHLAEKLGCVYCGYANGVVRYRKEIASRTEHYRCGIYHRKYPGFQDPPHHKKYDFAPYGDADGFAERYGNKGDTKRF